MPVKLHAEDIVSASMTRRQWEVVLLCVKSRYAWEELRVLDEQVNSHTYKHSPDYIEPK